MSSRTVDQRTPRIGAPVDGDDRRDWLMLADAQAAYEQMRGWAGAAVMTTDTRDVLAAAVKLNDLLGASALALINDARADEQIPPDRLHEMAALCDTISALLDNHADKLDRSLRLVTNTSDLPAGVAADAPVSASGRSRPHGGTGRVPPAPTIQH